MLAYLTPVYGLVKYVLGKPLLARDDFMELLGVALEGAVRCIDFSPKFCARDAVERYLARSQIQVGREFVREVVAKAVEVLNSLVSDGAVPSRGLYEPPPYTLVYVVPEGEFLGLVGRPDALDVHRGVFYEVKVVREEEWDAYREHSLMQAGLYRLIARPHDMEVKLVVALLRGAVEVSRVESYTPRSARVDATYTYLVRMLRDGMLRQDEVRGEVAYAVRRGGRWVLRLKAPGEGSC